MTIVSMEATNHQSTVIPKEELASEISLLVIMDTVFLESTSAMAITIVLTIPTKTNVTNAVSLHSKVHKDVSFRLQLILNILLS